MGKYKDFLTSEFRYPDNYKEILEEKREWINQQLEDHENYTGVDFCDVSAGGIQIRGHHKLCSELGYRMSMPQPTIEYDFSNLDEACEKFIELYKEFDTEEKIKTMTDIYKAFNKYGTT